MSTNAPQFFELLIASTKEILAGKKRHCQKLRQAGGDLIQPIHPSATAIDEITSAKTEAKKGLSFILTKGT